MPAVEVIQSNFTAGEISNLLFARVDVAKYQNACALLENFTTQRYGGLLKRGGTEYINTVKDSTKSVRLIPFEYSVTQAYVIELGDSYMRFYTAGGMLMSGGSPVEVATPWDQDEIWVVQFAQSADVLYLTHPDYQPRKLSRTSATTFTLETLDFKDGPYLDDETKGTTLKPAGTGSAVPLMTSNSAPSGTVSSAEGAADAYKIFDGDKASFYRRTDTSSGYIDYSFASGSKTVDAYWLTAATGHPQNMPSIWELSGYDGTDWVILDTQTGQSGWGGGETRYFEFTNSGAFQGYRLTWHTNDAEGDSIIAELGLHQKAEEQTAFALTASDTAGINDGGGFLASDVGRPIRLFGTDGKWRWARITSRVSSTVVDVQLYQHALQGTSPMALWKMGAWSDYTGWPGSVGFYQGRLGFARTTKQPQTVWVSQTDDFTNFGVSDPLVDSDSVSVTISSESINEIKWIVEGPSLFLGTSAAIRTLGPITTTSAFSPTNAQDQLQTNYGAASVRPVRVGNTIIYSGYYRQDVREISYSFENDGFVSNDLSILAEHIPAASIKQAAFSQNPDGIIWMVMDDGTFAGMTYQRDQDVIAFHRHILGGSYNGGPALVESVATIPGVDRDEVWIVVRRSIHGSAVRYVERLSAGLGRTDAKENATYLDAYLAYSGSATSSLSGLSHLEGETVKVWGNGAYLGEYVVASGAISLGAYSVTQACVGLSYTSAMELLSPEAGAAGGTAQDGMGRISEVFLRLNRSLGGMIGAASADKLYPILNRTTDDKMDSSAPLFTGDKRVPIEMGWERDKRIRVEHSDPTPFNLLGLIYRLKVNR